MWARLYRIMWKEKYLAVMLCLYLYMLAPLVAKMWQSQGNGILFAHNAFDESFLMSLYGSSYSMPFSFVGPLIAIVTCGNVFFDDLEAGCLPIMLTRESKHEYHGKNIASIIISCIFLFLVPLLLNLIVSLCCFSMKDSMMGSAYLSSTAYHNPYRDLSEHPNMLVLLREGRPLLRILLLFGEYICTFSVFAVLNYCLGTIWKTKKYLCNIFVEFIFIGWDVLTSFLYEPLVMSSYLNGSDQWSSLWGLLAVLVVFSIMSIVLLKFADMKPI